MGKKVAAKAPVVTKKVEKKAPAAAKEVAAKVTEVVSDNVTVALKKANDLKIKKQIKKMNAAVLEKVDLKQVVSAVKAL